MPPNLSRAPSSRRSRLYVAYVAALAAWTALVPVPARAYVFLDTSAPAPVSAPVTGPAGQAGKNPPPVTDSVPRPAAPPQTVRPPARDTLPARKGPPHYRAVLFLSADSKLIYAYIGVLKALEQYGLAPEAVLAESKAVAVGAAWAMGYDAIGIETWFRSHPLEALLSPFPAHRSVEERAYQPDGRDPPQWDLPLNLDALQTRSLKWTDLAGAESGEYLHLSWAIAKLTHDAPRGPVEDLKSAPRRLAVQVSDLESAQAAVVTEGNLQTILKSSLLPEEAVRRRPGLWPFASGALLSGHAVMTSKLPFTCDRVILIEPGRRLRPPALQPGPLPWTDSLALRAKALAVAQDAESSPGGLQAQALRIELQPGPGFMPDEEDPAQWIGLGYTSALRSMDVLKAALSAVAPGPAESPTPESPLSLNRLSVNPLAPGGHQMLLDILRVSEGDASDSAGEGSIEALTNSGYYSDLDVEWANGSEQEKALLVFDARERSKLRFRAGWNALVAGDEMRERPPEVFGGLVWNEPFYIPVEAEGGARLGGNRPGFHWRFAIAPIYPWPMHLGLGYAYSQAELDPPFQTSATAPMGALPFPVRYRRHVLQGFADVVPSPHFRSQTLVRSDSVVLLHESGAFPDNEAASPDSLKSVDFIEKLYIGLGKTAKDGSHPLAWTGRFRYVNPVVTSGVPRQEFSSAESRLRLAWKDFRVVDHYYWSDQEVLAAQNSDFYQYGAAYDLLQAGKIDAFNFQDDYFFRFLRSAHFQDVRLEFAPVWGRGGMKMSAGAWNNYGPGFFPEQTRLRPLLGQRIAGRAFWEVQAGYLTPFGSLRIGAGGLDGETPFYYIRIGSDARWGMDED
jgi:hypothetical protein